MKCKWCNSDIFETGMFEFEDEELQGFYCKACNTFITDNNELIPNFSEVITDTNNNIKSWL